MRLGYLGNHQVETIVADFRMTHISVRRDLQPPEFFAAGDCRHTEHDKETNQDNVTGVLGAHHLETLLP